MTDKPQTAGRTPIEQAAEATDLAEKAFAIGDRVTGIAAIQLAAQLVQLAKIQQGWKQ